MGLGQEEAPHSSGTEGRGKGCAEALVLIHLGRESLEGSLSGSSDFTSEKEKVTFEGGRSRDRVVVGSLRSLRKWAEAKKAAHWPGLFYDNCASFCKKFSNTVTTMEFNFT